MSTSTSIKTCTVSNWDQNQSTLAPHELIENDNASYIVTDCDEEMLILVEFTHCIHLKDISFYALPFDKDDIDADQQPVNDILKHSSPEPDVNIERKYDGYNEDVVAQLVKLNLGSMQQAIKASIMSINYNDINEVADKLKEITRISCVTSKIAKSADVSPPKLVDIYKTTHLNIDFNDIRAIKPDKKIQLCHKQIINGQQVEMCNNARNAVKFKSVRYLVIYIKTNQLKTEHTYLNCIRFNSYKQVTTKKQRFDIKTYSSKFAFDLPDSQMQSIEKLRELSEKLGIKELQNISDIKHNDDPKTLRQLIIAQDSAIETACNLVECPHFRNILIILDRYKSFLHKIISHNELEENENMMNCLDAVYDCSDYCNTDLLNDFNHILFYHKHQQEIMCHCVLQSGDKIACNLTDCYMMRRNQRDRTSDDSRTERLYFNVSKHDIIKQAFIDKIHCFLCHTFDIGYKLKTDEIIEIEQSANASDDADGEILSKYHAKIHEKQRVYQQIPAFVRLNNTNNKFLSGKGKDSKKKYYDFSHRFYYWDYFRGSTQKYDRTLGVCSEYEEANDGYTFHDMYIAAKYPSFKQELLHNDLCVISANAWYNLLSKAEAYLDTAYVKMIFKTNLQYIGTSYILKYYNIQNGDSVQLHHLIAMLAYCNYDKLQYYFSESFRYKNELETLNELKLRHRNYANWAKYLRELHFFGQPTDSFAQLHKTQAEDSTLFPPLMTNKSVFFYHGINNEMNFGAVATRIGSPLSTTSSFAIALSFVAQKGMLLTLEYNDNARKTDTVPYIDCVPFSNYPHEEERFFMGATIYMKLLNIISIDGHITQYRSHLDALLALQYAIATIEGGFHGYVKTDHQQKYIFRFLLHEFNRYYKDDVKYPPMESIPLYIETLLHNVCVGIRDFTVTDEDILDYFFRYDNRWIKLHAICTIFPRVRRIVLNNVKLEKSLFLSILSFLDQNRRTELKQIILKRVDEQALKKQDAIALYQPRFDDFNWYLFTTKYSNPKYTFNGVGITVGKALRSIESLKDFTYDGFHERKLGDWLIISSRYFPKPPVVDDQVIDPNYQKY